MSAQAAESLSIDATVNGFVIRSIIAESENGEHGYLVIV